MNYIQENQGHILSQLNVQYLQVLIWASVPDQDIHHVLFLQSHRDTTYKNDIDKKKMINFIDGMTY